MADLVISEVNLVRTGDQLTLPCAEAVVVGQYARFNTDGAWVLGNATAAGEVGAGKNYVMWQAGAIGETVTGFRSGCILDLGDALAGMSIGDPVYVSDTDGTLADSAGTVSTIIGYVVPIHTATTPAKGLRLDF